MLRLKVPIVIKELADSKYTKKVSRANDQFSLVAENEGNRFTLSYGADYKIQTLAFDATGSPAKPVVTFENYAKLPDAAFTLPLKMTLRYLDRPGFSLELALPNYSLEAPLTQEDFNFGPFVMQHFSDKLRPKKK